MQIFKEFRFEAAHFLPRVAEGHPCRNMHGHSYRMRIVLEGPLDQELGWLMDFAELKTRVKPVLAQLDHHSLNEVEGLENPTCENLRHWLWQQLKPQLPMLSEIELWETATSGARYRG